MSTVIFSPFAASSAEENLLYLLANYLHAQRQDIFQLRCNGLFPTCERDLENNWCRSIRTCLECVAEQRVLAKWSGVDVRELSTFLTPDEVRETYREIINLAPEELQGFRYRGVPLFELCKGSFRDRYGVDSPDLSDVDQLRELKLLLLSTYRMSLAVRRFNNRMMPQTALVIGGQDYLTRTFIAHCIGQGVHVVVFNWDVTARAINLINLRDNRGYACELVLEEIKAMRSNPESWPEELLNHLHGVIDFIGLSMEPEALKRAAQ